MEEKDVHKIKIQEKYLNLDNKTRNLAQSHCTFYQ